MSTEGGLPRAHRLARTLLALVLLATLALGAVVLRAEGADLYRDVLELLGLA